MKIVYTTSLYLPHMGGIEMNVHQLAQSYLEKGHEVTVIVSDKDCDTLSQEVIQGEHVIRIPCNEIGGISVPKKRNDVNIIEQTIKNADVVHLNSTKFLIGYFAKKRKQYNYKLIISSNGWFYHTKKNRILKDIYFKWVIVRRQKQFDGIINISKQDKAIAESHGIKKSCVIFPCVDIDKYSGIKEKTSLGNSFLYFGRIARNKGILECLHKLSEFKTEFCFNIIGSCEDDEYKKELRDFLNTHGMESKVHFLGRLSDEEIYQNIEECDIIMMPSLHEGFGITLVECIQSKRPIIANLNESYVDILCSIGMEEYLFNYQDSNSSIEKKIIELKGCNIVPHDVERYSTKTISEETYKVYT